MEDHLKTNIFKWKVKASGIRWRRYYHISSNLEDRHVALDSRVDSSHSPSNQELSIYALDCILSTFQQSHNLKDYQQESLILST